MGWGGTASQVEAVGTPPSCFFHGSLFLFPLIYTVFNQTVVYLEVNMKPICLSLKRPITVYIQRQQGALAPITVYIQRQQGALAPANFEDCGSEPEAGLGGSVKGL